MFKVGAGVENRYFRLRNTDLIYTVKVKCGRRDCVADPSLFNQFPLA